MSFAMVLLIPFNSLYSRCPFSVTPLYLVQGTQTQTGIIFVLSTDCWCWWWCQCQQGDAIWQRVFWFFLPFANKI